MKDEGAMARKLVVWVFAFELMGSARKGRWGAYADLDWVDFSDMEGRATTVSRAGVPIQFGDRWDMQGAMANIDGISIPSRTANPATPTCCSACATRGSKVRSTGTSRLAAATAPSISRTAAAAAGARTSPIP